MVSVADLSPRRRQVAHLAAQGLSNKQIARRLSLAPETVKSTLADTYLLLKVRGRGELAHLLLTTCACPACTRPGAP